MLSAPRTIVTASAEPIALDAAKTFLRIDGSDLDEEVEGYIGAARDDIERVSGTRLVEQTVEILADSFADLEYLQVGPVQFVVSIHYDVAGVQQLLDPAAYELFGADLERGIRPAFGRRWPAHRQVTGAIAVQLVVGYPEGELPKDLRWAVLALIRSKSDGTSIDIEQMLVNHRIWL